MIDEYIESYAKATEKFGFYIAVDPNNTGQHEVAKDMFYNAFKEYQKIPKEVRESFAQNENLERLVVTEKYVKKHGPIKPKE